MAETSTGSQERRKSGVDESQDKSYYALRTPLGICGKCNKRCTLKGEAIQCDLCCVWVHAVCEGITWDQYKAIKSLSSLDNLVYHCKMNMIMIVFRVEAEKPVHPFNCIQ